MLCLCHFLLAAGVWYGDLQPLYLHKLQLLNEHADAELQWTQNHSLLQNQKKLSLQKFKNILSPYVSKDDPLVLNSAFLLTVDSLCESAGLPHPVVDLSVWREVTGGRLLQVHLRSDADLPQFLQFITLMQSEQSALFLLDFSWRYTKKTFQLNADFAELYVPVSPQDYLQFDHPVSTVFHGATALTQISCQYLKMVGFLQYKGGFSAVLLLPDGESFLVARNDLVGIEKARVVNLDENQVVLHAPDCSFVLKNAL